MTTQEAIVIIDEIHKWQRIMPPYDKPCCACPYSPEQWDEAVEMSIEALKK